VASQRVEAAVTCIPHVPVVGSFWQPKRRDIGKGQLPSVLCGKCWQRVHPFLEVLPSRDDAVLRRHRKRRSARMRRRS